MLTVYCALIVAVFLYIVDLLSKCLVSQYCVLDDTTVLIKNFLDFRYSQNYGAAFGTMQNMRYVFIVVTVCVIAVMLVVLFSGKVKSKFCIWSFALIISGGLGNLTDRIFRTDGYVVDFLCFEFKWFPYIFNFADMCIVVGGVALIIYLIYDTINSAAEKKSKKTPFISDVNELE